MEIVSLPRQGGKTTKAIEWLLANENACLVVFNFKEKARIVEQYHDELEPTRAFKRIFTMQEFMETHPRIRAAYGRVGIDNADMILAEVFKTAVEFGTVTAADEKPQPAKKTAAKKKPAKKK